MTFKPKILCVVPQLSGDAKQNPGGQLTAANGLLYFLSGQGYPVKILNTASPSFPSPHLLTKVLQSLRRVNGAFRNLQSGEFSGAILFTGAGLSFFERLVICLLCRLFRVRSILFFRNSDILNYKHDIIKRFWLRTILRIPTKIAVQGKRWRQTFIEVGMAPDRIVVVPNWIPPDFKKVNVPKQLNSTDQVHFVFVGWLVEAKGVLTLMDAIEQLQDYLDFTVTIVGGGTLEERTRQHVALAGWKNVTVTGWKAANDISKILDTAHVFVLPTHHPEGFPNALLEAMAKGLPAISTEVGAIADSLHNGMNGFLIPVKDSDALAAAMRRYLDSPDLIDEHSKYTIALVKERHDLGTNCAKLLRALFFVKRSRFDFFSLTLSFPIVRLLFNGCR